MMQLEELLNDVEYAKGTLKDDSFAAFAEKYPRA
jgi:hypothetical protein